MTFHRGDTLLYRDREFDLVEHPLEPYFELAGQRPSFLRGAEGTRGYAAAWLVEDGWLYLSGIAGVWSDSSPLSLAQLFPVGGSKVFAAWFTGQLHAYRSGADCQLASAASRAPDLVLGVTCGRISTSSMVHRPLIRGARTLPHADLGPARVIDLQSRSTLA